MKEIQALLLEGKGAAARNRLSQLIAHQPDKAEAAAEAIVKLLTSAYGQFHIQAVHAFGENMDMELPEVVVDRIEKQIAPRIERTRHWLETLGEVTRERLVRECRGWITTNNPKQAAATALALIECGDDAKRQKAFGRELAYALVDFHNETDRKRAGAMIQTIAKSPHLQKGVGDELLLLFKQALDAGGARQFESTSQPWMRILNETVVSVQSALPGPSALGEPTPEELGRFCEEAHAILRAGMADGRDDDLVDALAILKEYCPADPIAIRNVAGVEDRMFHNLSPRAKLTTVRGLIQLAQIAPLRKAILKLAHAPLHQHRVELLAAIMGGLQHADFYPYLSDMMKKLPSKKDDRALRQVLDSLGRIGNPEAVKLLMGQLTATTKDLRDPTNERRALELIRTFGRLCRAKGMDPKERNRIVGRIVELIDRSDRQLQAHTAHELFTLRLGELDLKLKEWAVTRSIEAMWGQPPKGLEGTEPTADGWRETMVVTLKRLGSEMLPAILEAASGQATRYSGAMSSLANVLAEIGDKRVVPLLETMIRCAILYEPDPHQSKLFEEKVLDPATGQIQDLDRDDLIHTMISAMLKIGGDAGVHIVLDFTDQVQVGRLPSPGPKTASILVDTKQAHGGLESGVRRHTAVEIDPAVFEQALSDARGGLLGKRSRRIAALVTLGEARRPEGIEVLLDCFGHKDALIAGAAHTALAQYMMPLPDKNEYAQFMMNLLARPKALKGRSLDRLLEFIAREIPKNRPYDLWFEKHVEIAIVDEELAHRLRGAAQPTEKPAIREMPDEATDDDEATDAGEQTGKPTSQATSHLGEIEKKRAFLEARRQWVAGGKKGDEPKPPK